LVAGDKHRPQTTQFREKKENRGEKEPVCKRTRPNFYLCLRRDWKTKENTRTKVFGGLENRPDNGGGQRTKH